MMNTRVSRPADEGERIRAYFSSEADVRQAVIELEAAGVDAEFIDMSEPDPASSMNEVDRSTETTFASRYALGGFIGATALALLAGLGSIALDTRTAITIAMIIGGAIFGAWAGAFYGVATKLPMKSKAVDSGLVELDDDNGSPWIEVRGSSEIRQQARSVIEDLGPVRITAL